MTLGRELRTEPHVGGKNLFIGRDTEQNTPPENFLFCKHFCSCILFAPRALTKPPRVQMDRFRCCTRGYSLLSGRLVLSLPDTYGALKCPWAPALTLSSCRAAPHVLLGDIRVCTQSLPGSSEPCLFSLVLLLRFWSCQKEATFLTLLLAFEPELNLTVSELEYLSPTP